MVGPFFALPSGRLASITAKGIPFTKQTMSGRRISTPPERVTVNSSVKTKLLLKGFCQSISAMVGLARLPSINSVTEMPYNMWLYSFSLAVNKPSLRAGLHTSAIKLSMDFSDNGYSLPPNVKVRFCSSLRKA